MNRHFRCTLLVVLQVGAVALAGWLIHSAGCAEGPKPDFPVPGAARDAGRD